MKESKSSLFLFFAWAVSVLATAGSLYLSEVMHFEPCSLCWVQRIFMYPLVLLLGLAYFRDEAVIAVYTLPLASIGACFSIYHIFVQKFPDTIGDMAACGAVSCIGDYLNWFGFITIPMLALTAFILIIGSLIVVRRQR